MTLPHRVLDANPITVLQNGSFAPLTDLRTLYGCCCDMCSPSSRAVRSLVSMSNLTIGSNAFEGLANTQMYVDLALCAVH